MCFIHLALYRLNILVFKRVNDEARELSKLNKEGVHVMAFYSTHHFGGSEAEVNTHV